MYDGYIPVEWSLHQRMNAYIRINDRNIGIDWKWSYHTYDKLLPYEKYFTSHPEYFALVKGERKNFNQ